MDKKDLQKILSVRQELIDHFNTLRDYKNNKNALMKESDHAYIVHKTITQIDEILKEHVEFS